MTNENINWEYWKTFGVVLETGSLSGAARKLDLTQPTVGRHIDALEASLGAALFVRSQSGLISTSLARTLAPHSINMASMAQTLRRTAFNAAETVKGVARLTASEIVGTEILPSILASFRANYPAISIELELSNRQQDLLHRNADIAVRMTRPSQGKLTARKLIDIPLGLYAHKKYLDRYGIPENPDDLFKHDLIGVDRDTAQLGELEIAGRKLTPDDFALRCDSDLGQLASLRAGFGIGVCQLGIAAKDPLLVRVLPELIISNLPMWLVMHEDLKADKCVRRLYEYLDTHLGK